MVRVSGSAKIMWKFGCLYWDDEPSPSPHEMENSGQSVKPVREEMHQEHEDKYIPGNGYNSHADKRLMTFAVARDPRWRFEKPAKGQSFAGFDVPHGTASCCAPKEAGWLPIPLPLVPVMFILPAHEAVE